jgi:hypothetical protein
LSGSAGDRETFLQVNYRTGTENVSVRAHAMQVEGRFHAPGALHAPAVVPIHISQLDLEWMPNLFSRSLHKAKRGSRRSIKNAAASLSEHFEGFLNDENVFMHGCIWPRG